MPNTPMLRNCGASTSGPQTQRSHNTARRLRRPLLILLQLAALHAAGAFAAASTAATPPQDALPAGASAVLSLHHVPEPPGTPQHQPSSTEPMAATTSAATPAASPEALAMQRGTTTSSGTQDGHRSGGAAAGALRASEPLRTMDDAVSWADGAAAAAAAADATAIGNSAAAPASPVNNSSRGFTPMALLATAPAGANQQQPSAITTLLVPTPLSPAEAEGAHGGPQG